MRPDSLRQVITRAVRLLRRAASEGLLWLIGPLARAMEVAAWRYRVKGYRRRYDVDPSFHFNYGSRIYGGGEISLGPHSYLNDFASIKATEGTSVRVGRGCRIGPHVRIYAGTISPDEDLSDPNPSRIKGDIQIDDYAWIGANVYIGPGASIGANAVVGANSVVNRDVLPNEIVGGVPVRHIRFKELGQ